MERLQQALEKARADRGIVTSDQRRGDGATTASQGSAWLDLAECTPDQELLTRNRVVAFKNSREATPFDILRTKVVLQMRKHGWKRLAITSPLPTCGKSTIASNLMFGLSRQADIKAVLFEIDFRKPNLSSILGLTPARNVAAVLTGEISFADQAVRLGDNVGLSLAKGGVTNPAEVLLSQKAETVLREVEAEYQPDLVVFDTAPVLVGDDTRAFLGQVDCAMIVACAERTTVKEIDVCEREIAEQTNVLGVVLNQTRFSDGDGADDYGYGYGHSKA